MPPKRELTDDEKFALQLQAEQELANLQRQYNHLERDRREYAEDTGNKTAKQRNVLRIVKKEHAELVLDLTVATSDSKKKEDAKLSKILCNLLDDFDNFNEQMAIKQKHLQEIDDQIKRMQRDIITLKSKQVTDRQLDERLWNGIKHLETLENKLEVQVKKFCGICSKNREMRDEINHLLLDRQLFLKIWERLISNLNQGKKFMLDLIEQATIAYDQREEWCSKLQALRLKAHSDLITNIQEMREFTRQQDNNKKLQDFFTIKGQKRIMRDLELMEHEKRRMRKQKMSETLEHYRSMVDEVLEFTEETEIKTIAEKYVVKEGDNFTLFKYINDLNEEMEGLNDHLLKLYIEIDEERVLHETRSEQQQEHLDKLQQEYVDAKNSRNESEKNLKKVEDTLRDMMRGVEKLFGICKCETDPLIRLLGQNTTTNYYNINLWLEILEKKIQAMLLEVYLNEKLKKKSDERRMKDKTCPKIYTFDEITPTNPCPLCVEHEQVSDVIDSIQKPLSRAEAIEKLNKKLKEDPSSRLHNVSACHLPKSREIIQKRYQ